MACLQYVDVHALRLLRMSQKSVVEINIQRICGCTKLRTIHRPKPDRLCRKWIKREVNAVASSIRENLSVKD